MKLKLLWLSTKKTFLLVFLQIFYLQVSYAGVNYYEDKNKSLNSNALVNIIQDNVITGKITDENGLPLSGATVQVQDTSIGTSSDFDGNYSITVPEGSENLIVSYVGYITQTIEINDQSSINVQLEIDLAALDEVVVIGYGTLSKKNITGAISIIKADSFEDIPVASIDQAIAGQLAGVNISQISATPGATSIITIRGTGTITAGNQPLIVVDGLPLSESTSLNTINPNDVASVEVLKDAASAAIYGSRGANGVIIITTKKGRSGKPQFSFNSYIGYQQVENTLDLLNAREFAEYSRDVKNNSYMFYNDGTFSVTDDNATRAANSATVGGFTINDVSIATYLFPYFNGTSEGLTDTDWQDELFRDALIENYQLSVRGGSENVSYYISGDYFNQEGIVLGTDYERFSFRTNIDAKLSDKVHFKINMSPTLGEQNVVPGGFSTSPINSLLMSLPNFAAYNPDGTLNISEQVNSAQFGHARTENPIATALLIKDERTTFSFQGGTSLEYEFIQGLTAKTYFGVDFSNLRREYFDPSAVGRRNVAAPDQANGLNSNYNILNYVLENTLTYNKTINDKHNINALLGYTFQEEAVDFSRVTAADFPNDFVETLNAGIVNGGTSTSRKSTLLSYLARVIYDYEGKYLITAAVRRDGSSRFGSNTRFGTFPSLSAGYRISDENFFPKFDVFNDFKLRASWGLVGNNRIGDFASQALLGASNAVLGGNIQNGISPINSPNANLTWEQTSTFNFGLDFGLFNNGLTASIDYYIATTDDLLLQVPVPAHSGFTSSLQNIGKVENKGFEFALKGNYNLGPVKMVTSFNISANKNKVLALGPGQEEIISARNITRVGGELGANYGYRTDGIFQTQAQIDGRPSLSGARVGDYIFVDSNNDDVINSADKVVLGSVHPDYTFGINQNISYKSFNLGIVIQGTQGGQINDRTVSLLGYRPTDFANVTRDYYFNSWTPERGENAIYAAPRKGGQTAFNAETDVLLDDTSFVRVRNITLSYTLPESVSKLLNIDNLKLYLSATNPFTFTDFRGYNPEQGTGNPLTPQLESFDTAPIAKSLVFGVNLNF